MMAGCEKVESGTGREQLREAGSGNRRNTMTDGGQI